MLVFEKCSCRSKRKIDTVSQYLSRSDMQMEDVISYSN